MPTRDQIRATIDSRIDRELARIASSQADYLAAHGRYWQGGPTHSTLPGDGNDAAPDRWDEKVASEGKSWREMGGAPALMKSCLRIDNYDGPLGKGYVLVLKTKVAGKEWERCINVGPDASFERPWFKPDVHSPIAAALPA